MTMFGCISQTKETGFGSSYLHLYTQACSPTRRMIPLTKSAKQAKLLYVVRSWDSGYSWVKVAQLMSDYL